MRSAEGINLTAPGTSAGDRRLFSAWGARPGHQAKPGPPGPRRGLLKVGDGGPLRALCPSWAGRTWLLGSQWHRLAARHPAPARIPPSGSLCTGRPRAGVRQPLREAQAANGTHEEPRVSLRRESCLRFAFLLYL